MSIGTEGGAGGGGTGLAMGCGLLRSLSRGKAGLPGLEPSTPGQARGGDLLTFVVKSNLPTGRSRKQHYINESWRRHEICCGKSGSAWTWVEGRKTPRDSASFQLGNP